MDDEEVAERARIIAEYWRRLEEIKAHIQQVPDLERERAEIYEQLRQIFNDTPK
jgi:hypothetical protein